jgi:hypothetical protein
VRVEFLARPRRDRLRNVDLQLDGSLRLLGIRPERSLGMHGAFLHNVRDLQLIRRDEWPPDPGKRGTDEWE